MSSLEFTTIKSDKEYDEAYQLAVEIFSPSSLSNTYEDLKRVSWLSDPFFSYKNILHYVLLFFSRNNKFYDFIFNL